MSEAKPHRVKDIFVDGPIDPQFVATSLAKHATRLDIGAHELFLGQVRADVMVSPSNHDEEGTLRPLDVARDRRAQGDTTVEAIDYTAYRDMALERMTDIREEAFAKWPSMTCLHVHHSLGRIPAGQLCFFVFASAPHRLAAREAVAWVVDRVKADLPIFGREVLSDSTHVWKRNS